MKHAAATECVANSSPNIGVTWPPAARFAHVFTEIKSYFYVSCAKRRVDRFVNSGLYLKCVFFCRAGNSNHKQEYLRSLNEDTNRRNADRMIDTIWERATVDFQQKE